MTLTMKLRCIAAALLAGLMTVVLVATLAGALHPAVAATAGDGQNDDHLGTRSERTGSVTLAPQ